MRQWDGHHFTQLHACVIDYSPSDLTSSCISIISLSSLEFPSDQLLALCKATSLNFESTPSKNIDVEILAKKRYSAGLFSIGFSTVTLKDIMNFKRLQISVRDKHCASSLINIYDCSLSSIAGLEQYSQRIMAVIRLMGISNFASIMLMCLTGMNITMLTSSAGTAHSIYKALMPAMYPFPFLYHWKIAVNAEEALAAFAETKDPTVVCVSL